MIRLVCWLSYLLDRIGQHNMRDDIDYSLERRNDRRDATSGPRGRTRDRTGAMVDAAIRADRWDAGNREDVRAMLEAALAAVPADNSNTNRPHGQKREPTI